MKTRFNKILSVLLVLIMLVSAVPLTVSAATSGMCGDNLYWSFDEATGELTISGEGEMSNYSWSYDVPWCDYTESIKSVVIGEEVTSLGYCAFQDCVNLKNVVIPNKVISIGFSAFEDCRNFTTVTIGDGLTYIGYRAFRGCSSLVSINIPDSVTVIGDYAFYECTKLENITIPDSVTDIAYYAFYGCHELGNVKLPQRLTYIDCGAFSCCYSITSITVPDDITSIGEVAFSCCQNLISITLSNSISMIDSYAFYDCNSLTDIYFYGTNEEWENIKISEGNTPLFNANIHFLEKPENVEIDVAKIGRVGDTLTASIDLTSGTFNSIDFAFEMNGLVCTSIEKGDFDENSEALFVSNTASNATNNIAIASFDSVTPGTLAVVTLEVTDDSYSFNVKATACDVLDDDESVAVEPIISSDVSGFEHRYSAVVTPPTCTHRGYTTYTCPCGEKYKGDYVGSTGHSFTEWISVREPDCVNYGEEYRYCLNCEDEETRFPEPNGQHSYNSNVTDPTCTEQGYTTYTCHCGDSYVGDYVSSTGHTPGEWEVTVPATSLADGTKVLKCSVCSTVIDTQSIPKLGCVNSVSIDNFSMQYKTSAAFAPVIVADNGVEYSVTYSTSDPSVASVDENGTVTALGTGSAEITCTVTDEYGNVVTDTATVEVKYVWWQWIIVILLFGWIWY